MKTINGYRITKEFTTSGGGNCRWAICSKDDKEYFIKEFLEPKYPTDEAPGSFSVKTIRRENCKKFEDHQKRIFNVLKKIAAPDGNLVVTIDFFREGMLYYKITEKVDFTPLLPTEICKLPFNQIKLIMLTAAASLMILHNNRIVHGDLKPENILIKKKDSETFIAKLIDFDNSFFSKEAQEPSEESDIVGTMNYYSPELARYIKNDGTVRSTDLDEKSDIYALGVVFCQYLTGKFPLVDSKVKYAWESSIVGKKPIVESSSLSKSILEIVNEMLNTNPCERPTTLSLIHRIKKCDVIVKAPDATVWKPDSGLIKSRNLRKKK